MKLNNLSRLTALLLALTMILPTFAVAEDGTDFDQITEDYLNSVAETVVLIDTLVADGYCETCAADVAAAGLTAWPVSGYTCLYEHLDDLSASAAYDMLIAYYNANTAEGDSLWKAYITSHNNHVINAANAGSSEYPAIICDCDQPVLKPGDSNHGTSCPWADEEYVTTTTLTDTATGITVTGDIPAGVKLEVKTATKPSIDTLITMIDPSKYAEEFTVLAYDITLKQADGTAWQPTSAVTVTVPGAYSNVPANPMAEAVHMLADGGHEVLATTVNANGSVSFVATRFSTYYVVAGKENTYNRYYGTDINELNNGDEHTFYVEKGVSLIFNQGASTTWTISGDNSYSQYFTPTTKYVTAVNAGEPTGRFTAIDVSDQAPVGASITYTLSWSDGYQRATLTFIVQTHDYIVDSAINSTTYPVILAIDADGSDGIPGEPGVNPQESWLHITSSYGIQTNRANFASSGKDIINPEIKNDIQSWTNSVDGSSTYGVYDPTGVNTKKYLENIDWDRVLQLLVGRVTATDGERLTTTNMNDYEAIPYVVKLMSARDIGWHIDCAVVKKSHVTLSYDLNLKGYIVTSHTLSAPGADSGAKPHTTSAAGISGITVGQEINATLLTDATETYKIKFLGWSTDPNATTVEYEVGKSIKIDENTMLYAVWEGKKIVSSLTIAKELEGEGLETNTTEFTFNVTNEEGSYNQEVKVKAGSSLQLPNLNPGNYTVTELAPPDIVNYVFKGVKIDNIETEPTNGTYSTPIVIGEGASTVTFTNVYELDVADLTLTKQVIGVDADDLNGKTFSFTVTGVDTPVVLSADNNWTYTLSNLPVGKYTITETRVDIVDYDLTDVKVGGTSLGSGVYSTEIEVKKGENTAVTFTNEYKKQPGDLKITKQVDTAVSGVNPPENARFTFTIKLSDTTLNGLYGGATFTNGEATITLTAGQNATITGLPADTAYTVIEATVPAFTTQVGVGDDKGDDDALATPANTRSGKIDAAGTDEVTFTNTYQTGNLIITKFVDPAAGAPIDTFTMNVTLSLPTTDSVKFPDSYSVSYSNSTATSSISSTGGTIQLLAGQSATIVGLPYGTTYKVEEPDNVSYQENVAPAEGTIDSAEETVTVTNTYLTGDLTITKVVGDVGEPDSDSFTIEVAFTLPNGQTTLPDSVGYTGGTLTSGKSTTMTFTGIKDGNSITIRGLPYGTTYEVTEATPPQYYNAVAGYKYLDSQKKIDSEDNDTVEVTNTYNTGELEITKEVKTADDSITAPADEFAITVKLTLPNDLTALPGSVKQEASTGVTAGNVSVENGVVTQTFTGVKKDGKITFYGLPVGTKYAVLETKKPAYYETTGEVKDTDNRTIATGTNAITITNEYQSGSLQITKAVTSDPAGVTPPTGDKFTIVVTLAAPEGSKVDWYSDVTYAIAGGATGANYAVSGNTITFTGILKDSVISITGLPAGTTYKITEAETYPSYYTKAGEVTEPVAIVAGQIAEATLTNTYHTCNLVVEKEVVSANAGTTAPDDVFELKVTFGLPTDHGATAQLPTSYTKTDKNGNTSTVNFTVANGVVTISNVKAGDKFTFNNLPAGTTYKVEESTSPSYYTKSGEVTTATPIADGSTKTVKITNTYYAGSLMVKKNVTSDPTVTTLPDERFAIDVKIELPANSGTALTLASIQSSITKPADVEVNLEGNVFHFTNVANASEIHFGNLPYGTQYTVTEITPPGYYDVAIDNGNATIGEQNQKPKVTITNTYKTGTLKITKKVEGNAPADEFAITVTLTLPKGMTTLPDSVQYEMTAGEYTVSEGNVTYTVGTTGGTLTISGLPVGTTYTVTESTPPSYYTSDIRFADDNKAITNASEVDEVTVTNTYNTGSLTVTKSVTSNPAVATLPQDTFTIDVELELPKDNGAKVSLDYIANSISSTNGKGATVTKTASGFQITGAVDGTQIVFNNLPHGTKYSVAEIGQPGYFDVKYNGSATAPTNVEIDAISTTSTTKVTSVAITNTYLTGNLEITKVVDGTGMPADDSFTIDVAFKLPEGNATIPTRYTLSEGVSASDQSTTTVDGVKCVTIQFTGVQHTDRIVITGLPYGTTYSVTEETPAAYYTEGYTYDDSTEKKIGNEAADKVTVTNTYITGSLDVTKEVVGVTAPRDANGKGTDEFSFTLKLTLNSQPVKATIKLNNSEVQVNDNDEYTFTLKDGETAQFTQLPANVQYTVTETKDEDYTTTVPTNATGTIVAGATNPAEVKFTNTYKVGALTIIKNVSGVGANANDTFVFTVSGPGIVGTLKVVLKANQTVTIPNLKVGTYTVTEDTNWSWRYKLSDNGRSVDITENTTTKVTFTNVVDNPYWLDGSDYNENNFGNTGN